MDRDPLDDSQLEIWAEVQTQLKVGGWSLDVITGVPFVTDEVKAIYGHPKDEDLPVEEGLGFFHEEDRPQIVKGLEDAIAKGVPYDLTLRVIRYDKKEIWVRARCRPVKDNAGQVVKLLGSLQDVTSEVLKAEEREQLVNRMSLALRVTNIGIWDWDIVNNHLVWDDEMYLLYGVEVSTFSSAYEAWRSVIHPDDREAADQEVQDALAGAPFDTCFRVVRGDGSVRWIKGLARVFRDGEGRPLRMLGANMDISGEEDAKRELHEQVQINNHQSKLAALGELAAGVGHEVNNPLAVIKGSFSLLKSALADAASLPSYRSEFAKWEEKMEVACERVEKIVGGLRVFARSDGEGRTAIDLRDAIDQALLLTSDIFLKEGIDLQSSLPAEACCVAGNVGHLSQVLVNLLSNARDAVSKNQREKNISLTLESLEDSYRIAVQDNGLGISPEVKKRLYESFFTTKPVGVGTGIGLSLAKRIALEHGGELSVESEVGRGTTFFLELPALKGEPESPSLDEPKLDAGPPRLHRVLVVEDEEAVREVLQALLESQGCEVTSLASAEEAQALLKRGEFDFLFTDLNLRGMSGFELIDWLHGLEGASKPRIIAMTGGVAGVTQTLSEKTDEILFKPYNVSQVNRILEAALP